MYEKKPAIRPVSFTRVLSFVCLQADIDGGRYDVALGGVFHSLLNVFEMLTKLS